MTKKAKPINHDKRITIRLSSELTTYYTDIANKKGISLSKLLRLILQNHKKTLDEMSDILYN